MTRTPRLLLAAAIAAGTALSPGLARADASSATCTLKVIHATPAPGGVDPQLQNLKARLESEFGKYKSFKLLSSKDEQIREGGSARYPAPTGTVTVAYTGHSAAAGKHSVNGTMQIETPKLNSKVGFKLDEGGTYLTAGVSHDNGILVFALSCKTAD